MNWIMLLGMIGILVVLRLSIFFGNKFGDKKFSNYASGFQSIIIGVGLIVGGLWSYHRYSSLDDVVSLNMDIKNEFSGSISKRNKLMKVTVSITNNGSRHVVLDLGDSVIQKILDPPIILDPLVDTFNAKYINHYPLIVENILFERGKFTVQNALASLKVGDYVRYLDGRIGINYMSSQEIQPKSTKALIFLIPIHKEGTYFVEFRAPVTVELENKLDNNYWFEKPDVDIDHNNTPEWVTSDYIYVKKD
jgi:hypothetical protein